MSRFVSSSVADVDPAQPRAPRRANPLPDDAAGIDRARIGTEAIPAAVPVSPRRGGGGVGGERSRADRGGGSKRKRQFAQHWEFLLFGSRSANIVCYVGPVG